MLRALRFWSVLASLWLIVLCTGSPGGSEDQAQGSQGRLDDAFLENLMGRWRIARRVRGTVVGNTLEAEWTLQHRFVELHMKDVAVPPQYEALVLIGYDAERQSYVAHWCDTFGGRYSAVGYGKREGDSIDFVFSYPDGPFHNTFSWNAATRGWTFLMEAEGKDGKRAFFAEDTVTRE